MRHFTYESTIKSFFSLLTDGREVARQRVWEELQAIIEPYNMGVSIIDMNFRDARPPEQVKDAFDDAISAHGAKDLLLGFPEAWL